MPKSTNPHKTFNKFEKDASRAVASHFKLPPVLKLTQQARELLIAESKLKNLPLQAILETYWDVVVSCLRQPSNEGHLLKITNLGHLNDEPTKH